MMGMAEFYVESGPPYVGDSDFKDKARVKANGGRWNGAEKKWEAQSTEDLGTLLRSGVWFPAGYDPSIITYILDAIDRIGSMRAIRAKSNGVLLFDRRGGPEFDASKDTENVGGTTFRYTQRCCDCNVLLDSRLQFGLECICSGNAGFWKACHGCRLPVRLGGSCDECAA